MNVIYHRDSSEATTVLASDPTLKPIFDKTAEIVIKLDSDLFLSLVSTIIYQQLSGTVAEKIYQRVKLSFDGEITVDKMINADPEQLRLQGFSYRKISYLQSLANEVKEKNVDLEHIRDLSDKEVIEMLTRIKGIGQWSAEMFLLFSLGRKDVFSSRDLGLRKALGKLHGRPISMEEAEILSDKWTPHKSIVSLFLWRYLENQPKDEASR